MTTFIFIKTIVFFISMLLTLNLIEDLIENIIRFDGKRYSGSIFNVPLALFTVLAWTIFYFLTQQ